MGKKDRQEVVDKGLRAFLQLVAEGVIVSTRFERRRKTEKSIVLAHDGFRSFPVNVMKML